MMVRGSRFSWPCRFLEDCQTPMAAELRAGVEGLEMARQHTQLPTIIEMDCFLLVAAVTCTEPD
jgi:hypothetical protein